MSQENFAKSLLTSTDNVFIHTALQNCRSGEIDTEEAGLRIMFSVHLKGITRPTAKISNATMELVINVKKLNLRRSKRH